MHKAKESAGNEAWPISGQEEYEDYDQDDEILGPEDARIYRGLQRDSIMLPQTVLTWHTRSRKRHVT